MRSIIMVLCLMLITVPAFADSITFSWTPPTTNCDGSALTDLAGYIVICGDAPGGPYTQECVVNDPSATSYTCDITGTEGETAYCVVVAFDTNGNRSDDQCGTSNEVAYPFPMTAPAPPTGVTVQ